MKRRTISIIAAVIAFFIIAGIPLIALNAQQKFKDTEKHWAKKFIDAVVATGIVSGYPDGNYRPNNNISRAEFLAMLVKAEGTEVQTDLQPSFLDTEKHWVHTGGFLETAVTWGLIKPEEYPDGKFFPDQKIIREEAAIWLVRAINKEKKALDYSAAPLEFKDAEEISENARGYVYVAVNAYILRGDDQGYFKPKAYTTRAEAATMLVKRLDAAPTAGCFKHH